VEAKVKHSLEYCAAILLVVLWPHASLQSQGVCDPGNGPLNPAPPPGITPAEIIQKFAAKEAVFKAARERYGYTLDITIQTFTNSGRVDGEYRQTSRIILNDAGKRVEETTFAPESTLRRLSLTEDDFDDIRERLLVAFTPDQLPHFSISYVGRQRVDQLDTYVFDVYPQNARKEHKVFHGRIWVDDQDLMIVKTCGQPRQDENANLAKKNAPVSLTPLFVTYRDQVDGQFWFPTYSRADELLRFPGDFIHIREVVKYSDYKPLWRPK
jgi:hypothetical protein